MAIPYPMETGYFDVVARAQKGYARLLAPICKKWSLTRNEMDVLLFLANNPGLDRAADIVTHRGLSKSHVSLSVASLEERGFLRRQEDPNDRRTIRLRLTEEVRPVVEVGQMAQKRFMAYIHNGVTREQQDALRAFLAQVSKNIENIEEVIE